MVPVQPRLGARCMKWLEWLDDERAGLLGREDRSESKTLCGLYIVGSLLTGCAVSL
eukprot:COSAG01_NODE_1081_length_11817_cov_3.279911_4_plen_56_part_00